MLAIAPAAMAGAKGRGEDEARRIGADGVAAGPAPGNITAHDAEALSERAIDNVDAVHDAVALGDAAATRAVEADRVDLIEISQRVVFLRQVTNGLDWRDMAVHGVDALEDDDLRRRCRDLPE